MWSELVKAIESGAVVAYGATPGWAAWLAAERSATELVIVVAPDEDTARELEDDVRFWIGAPADSAELDPIAALPGIDVSPYAELSPDRSCIVERVATLFRLTQLELRPRIVITSAEALTRKTLPPSELASRGLVISKGQNIDRDQIAKSLVEGGWSRTPVVDEPGTFALRGGVVDVYAPLAPHPVRIELFGDEVESLRWFDAESQRTLREVDRVCAPARVGAYPSFVEEPADVSAFFDAATWDRLREVKALYDPSDRFRGNHHVPPAY